MSPKAVVFDIGNVLIEWNPERMYDRVIGVERRRALFNAVDLHGMNIRVDAGANWITEVRALAAAHPDFTDEIMLWHDRWIEMASPVIPQSVQIMDANSGSAAGIIYRGPVAYHDSTLGYAIAGAWWHPFFRAWLGIGAANLSLGAAAIIR